MKILQNVYILYVIFLISLLNIGWFIYHNNYNSLIAFITCCLTVYLINHNMIVVLGISMIVVNTLSMFNLVKIINNSGVKEGNTGNTNTIRGIRYIRIVNSTQSNPIYIQIGGIKAFDMHGTNVALGKPVSSSGNWPGFIPQHAVDNNPHSSYHSLHPPRGATDYWQVDLGQEFILSRIEYSNRHDCCRERIIGQTMILNDNAGEVRRIQFQRGDLNQNFTIYTQDEVNNKVKHADKVKFDALVASAGNLNSNTVQGIRYIRIVNSTQSNPIYIQIGGIKAFTAAGANVASGKTTTASGNWGGYDPYKAVDDSQWSSFHTAHPPRGATDFWEVDLGQEFILSRIEYLNRHECCRERINGQTMILKNGANKPVKYFQFTSNQLQHNFVVYTETQIKDKAAADAIIAAAEAEALKIKNINEEKSYNQSPLIQPFKNKSDSDSEDDSDDDEKSSYMEDKTIIKKLKKLDPVITDLLMNMKNGHIDTINNTLNSIIDGNILDV